LQWPLQYREVGPNRRVDGCGKFSSIATGRFDVNLDVFTVDAGVSRADAGNDRCVATAQTCNVSRPHPHRRCARVPEWDMGFRTAFDRRHYQDNTRDNGSDCHRK
jgi:hypothetical protein